MERICSIGFPVYDLGHIGFMYGDHDRGKFHNYIGQLEYSPLIPTKLLWGPLCFVVAYLTATRHSLRHPIQVIVCMSHLYGDMLYYATSLFDEYVHERPYSRPEPYYFWLYYFLMNFIWIVVPACMSCNSRAVRYKLTFYRLSLPQYLHHLGCTQMPVGKRKDKRKE